MFIALRPCVQFPLQAACAALLSAASSQEMRQMRMLAEYLHAIELCNGETLTALLNASTVAQALMALGVCWLL